MRVRVDSREKKRAKEAVEYYSLKKCDVEIITLDYGDYLFYEDNSDNGCIFEYKRIDDYMQSIKNESLFNEAMNQALHFPFHYVIIVGSLKQYVTGNWAFARQRDYPKYVHDNYARYYGALRRLRSFTTTIEVGTEEQAFNEMLQQAEKCLDGKSRYYSNVTRPIPSQDPVDVLLCSARGVSSKKAESIRKHHSINKLYDLMNLTVEDFKQVKGIGESVANNIYEFIHTGE